MLFCNYDSRGGQTFVPASDIERDVQLPGLLPVILTGLLPGGRRRLETETKKEEEQPVNFNEEALKLHAEHKGKIEIRSKVPVNTRDDLSTAYTPGVA